MNLNFFKSFRLSDNKGRLTCLGIVLLLLLPFLAPLADDPNGSNPPRKRLFESESSYRQRVDQWERQDYLNGLPADQRAAAEARRAEMEEMLNRHLQSQQRQIDD